MTPTRTLNAADCVAKGTSIFAAHASKKIKIPEIYVEEYNLYDIEMEIIYPNDYLNCE